MTAYKSEGREMKISFILPGNGISGGVRVTATAANLLLARGHEVRILYRKSPLTAGKIYRSMLLFLRNNHGWLKGFGGRVDSFKEITSCTFGENEIIVGIGMMTSDELASLASLSNPKIQYIHEASTWNPELIKRAVSLPVPKMVVAPYLKPFIESRGGNVLAVISNGIDLEEYFCSHDESEKNGVGLIYSSHPAKDPKTLLAVIERLSNARPETPIRIFGSCRRPKEIRRGIYRRYPSVEEAREIYSKTSVWVMASRSEGFPAPVFEAMACGCAVVATDCGGTRDMIVDGENGFLVEVGNVEEIVDRVFLLLDDRERASLMRKKAKETVEKFTWEKAINEMENVFERLNAPPMSKN